MPEASKPRVLLLGDSIRLSYTPTVTEALEGAAEVVGPEDNCAHTLYTLYRLEAWLAEFGKPDIVHWNNGIHDVISDPQRNPKRIPEEAYIINIGYILSLLLVTGAQVIWATTTPVHPTRCSPDSGGGMLTNENIASYNEATRSLMKRYGVAVNDLNALVMSDPDEFLGEDHLHLSEAGERACGKAVADAIRPYLAAAAD